MSMMDELKAEIVQLLFNNSTASGDCREKLAEKIVCLCIDKSSMANGTPLHGVAQSIFRAAMVHAAEAGETVMEFGGDENFYQTAYGADLLRDAASYFDNAI